MFILLVFLFFVHYYYFYVLHLQPSLVLFLVRFGVGLLQIVPPVLLRCVKKCFPSFLGCCVFFSDVSSGNTKSQVVPITWWRAVMPGPRYEAVTVMKLSPVLLLASVSRQLRFPDRISRFVPAAHFVFGSRVTDES